MFCVVKTAMFCVDFESRVSYYFDFQSFSLKNERVRISGNSKHVLAIQQYARTLNSYVLINIRFSPAFHLIPVSVTSSPNPYPNPLPHNLNYP
jgi:hypothetical protein